MKIMTTTSHKNIKREICVQNICVKYGLSKPVEDWWFLQGDIGGVIIAPLYPRSRNNPLETTCVNTPFYQASYMVSA